MKFSYTYYWNAEQDENGRNIGLMDGYLPGHKLQIAHRGFIETAVFPDVRKQSDLEMVAEALFFNFNNPAKRPAGYRGPSMSIGSVIEIQGVCFRCMSFGFEITEIWQSPIELGPWESSL
jgi:hypothetical protein